MVISFPKPLSDARGDHTAVLGEPCLRQFVPLKFLGPHDAIRVALHVLAYAEPLGVSIKDEPFTRDQSNPQEILITFAGLLGNSVNERVAFQARLPDRWKILPLSHHVRAVAREIDRSFVPHINNVDRGSATDLIQINLDHPEARNALASCARSFRYLLLCPSHFPEHPEPPIQRGPGGDTYVCGGCGVALFAFATATSDGGRCPHMGQKRKSSHRANVVRFYLVSDI